MRALDRIDRRLLELLQRDGRASIARLATEVGLSPRACLDRVRRLERDGTIAGYHARVDPRRLGPAVCVTVLVRLGALKRATQVRFEARMRDCPEVVQCIELGGRFDYLLRVQCRDLDHYRALSSRWTDDATLDIERLESLPELSTVKPPVAVPLGEADDDDPPGPRGP